MGKFDGVLFFADYDDTLYNSAHTVAPEDRTAIQWFIANGGRFSIATGRAWRTFTPQIERERIPINAPVVLSNGASVYDYAEERWLIDAKLPAAARDWVDDLCREFPSLGFEAYHGEDIYVYRPNDVTWAHLAKVATPYVLSPIPDMPVPWSKAILQQEGPYLKEVQARLLQLHGGECEAIFSNRRLLEVTPKGCDKGAMVAEVARRLGVDRKDLYCIGDNQNDIPMLAQARIGFTPSNCAPAVKEWGARVLGSCDEHAVAQAIEILDGLY